jgi:hypothetical protein
MPVVTDPDYLYGGGPRYWEDLNSQKPQGHDWQLLAVPTPVSLGIGAGTYNEPAPYRICKKCKYIQGIPYWGWPILENPTESKEPPKCGVVHEKPDWVDQKLWDSIGSVTS